MSSIRSERLGFRRCQPSDFDALLDIYGRPEVARMVTSWPIPPDHELIRERCHPFPDDLGLVGLVTDVTGETVVGSIGLTRDEGADPGAFSIGYGFLPKYWGQGFATEIASVLIAELFGRFEDAARIEGAYFLDNPASGKVLTKLGFVPARNGRMFSKGRNAEADCLVMVLSRERWLEFYGKGAYRPASKG